LTATYLEGFLYFFHISQTVTMDFKNFGIC